MLQTAVLYGHTEMVSFLLTLGADPTLVTTDRRLTCLHLLAMIPQDVETDASIFQLLASARQRRINWPETRDNLTSFHMAVRNKKLYLARSLLNLGADPLIPVSDQIDLLSEGRSGMLSSLPIPLPKLADHVTILGEVLLQCNQDEFYALSYAASLPYLILKSERDRGRQHLYVDSARTIKVLHLLALLPFPDGHRIFSFAASVLTENHIDVVNSNGDTPPALCLYLLSSKKSAYLVEARVKSNEREFIWSHPNKFGYYENPHTRAPDIWFLEIYKTG